MACRDLPYAVFGHSMGAWIAFEMAQVIGKSWQSHRYNGVCILHALYKFAVLVMHYTI